MSEILEMPKQSEQSDNGVEPAKETAYIFNVAGITAREVARFNKHRMPSEENTAIQIEIMNGYITQTPDGAEPELYVGAFMKMRQAFTDALALNKDEAVGYRFNVDKLTHKDLSLIMLYARANNIDKLSPLLDKYLTHKPKGVDDLNDLSHAIYDSVSARLLDAIQDLSKN